MVSVSEHMERLRAIGGNDKDLFLEHLFGNVEPPQSAQESRRLLQIFDGYWRRADVSDAPYVRLTSGGVSDGYVNWWAVLRYTLAARFVAESLIRMLEKQLEYAEYGGNAWVFGVPDGMTQFAALMATHCYPRGKSAPIAKLPDKSMAWERDTIGSEERVLVVEDVTTTRGSIERAMEAIRVGNHKRAPDIEVQFFPFVCCLTNRSGHETLSDGKTRILSLTTENFRTWSAQEFEKEHPNARVLKPKADNNWPELMKDCAPLG